MNRPESLLPAQIVQSVNIFSFGNAPLVTQAGKVQGPAGEFLQAPHFRLRHTVGSSFPGRFALDQEGTQVVDWQVCLLCTRTTPQNDHVPAGWNNAFSGLRENPPSAN